MRRSALLLALAYIAGVIVGAFATFPGTTGIDDMLFLAHTTWALHMYGLGEGTQYFPDFIAWYGPLWDMALGLMTQFPFAFLHDPVWVRHTLTFALLPFTLMAVALLLRQNGVRRPTVAVVIGLLLSFVRWDGHALVNTRDFPFACAFLLVTLVLWRIIQRHAEQRRHLSLPVIGGMALLALIPPLIRIPAFMHTPVLIAGCVVYACLARRMGIGRRVAVVVTPILVTLAALAVLYPALRFFPHERWLEPFGLFGQWPLDYPYRLFGEAYSGHTTPWWYGGIWLWIGMHPLGFVTFLAGAIGLAIIGVTEKRFPIQLGTLRLRFGVEHALLGMSLLPWLAIVVMHSTLYDEERHILFLYPPLIVAAGLGLRKLSDKLQYAIAAVLIVCAVVTTSLWGRYAYTYMSPLLPGRTLEDFSGDYWGLCVNDAVTALPDFAPDDTRILTPGIVDIVNVELARHRENPLLRDARYDHYVTVLDVPGSGSYLRMTINRLGTAEQALEDVTAAKATLVWQSELPLGETGCVVTRYPGR